jgi:hypothetical protein
MAFLVTTASNTISWSYHQISHRVSNFCSAGSYAYQGTIAGALAAITTVADLIQLGSNRNTRLCARNFSADFDYSISKTFEHALKSLNPSAEITMAPTVKKSRFGDGSRPINSISPSLREFAVWQHNTMRELNSSPHMFNRQISARLAAPLMAIAGIVRAVVRTIIGVITALFALVTCGYFTDANTIGYYDIANTGFIINQVHQGVLGFFRPSLV